MVAERQQPSTLLISRSKLGNRLAARCIRYAHAASVAFSCALMACTQSVPIDVEAYVINPRFRPDMMPLTSLQSPSVSAADIEYMFSRRPAPVLFSNGGPQGETLTTPTVPTATNVPGTVNVNQIYRGQCYWVGERDELETYWELVLRATNPVTDDRYVAGCYPLTYQRSDPLLRGFEPFTRRNLLDDSGNVSSGNLRFSGDYGSLGIPSLYRRVRTVDFPNREGACLTPWVTNGAVDEELDDGLCQSPLEAWCNRGCVIPVAGARNAGVGGETDAIFLLLGDMASKFEIDLEQERLIPLEMLLSHQTIFDAPVYQQVRVGRSFARKMDFSEGLSMSQGQFIFQWTMPVSRPSEGQSSRPEFNFHPSLASNVRFYIRRGERKDYIWPDRIEATGPSGGVLVNCRTRPDVAKVHDQLSRCTSGQQFAAVTPISPVGALQDGESPAEWTAKFSANNDPFFAGGPEFGEEVEVASGELWIEFMLYEAAQVLRNDMFLSSPKKLRFGHVASGFTKPNTVLLENLSNNPASVTDLTLASGVNFRIASPSSTPISIPPRSSVPVVIEAIHSYGPMTDTLISTWSMAGQVDVRETKLVGDGVAGQEVIHAPESLSLWISNDPATWGSRTRRAFLVANVGILPVDRDQIRIEGPDASAFQLIGRDVSRYPENDPHVPVVIPSGGDSIVDVDFVPPGHGDYEAVIVIESNSVNRPRIEIPVTGSAPM